VRRASRRRQDAVAHDLRLHAPRADTPTRRYPNLSSALAPRRGSIPFGSATRDQQRCIRFMLRRGRGEGGRKPPDSLRPRFHGTPPPTSRARPGASVFSVGAEIEDGADEGLPKDAAQMN